MKGQLKKKITKKILLEALNDVKEITEQMLIDSLQHHRVPNVDEMIDKAVVRLKRVYIV